MPSPAQAILLLIGILLVLSVAIAWVIYGIKRHGTPHPNGNELKNPIIAPVSLPRPGYVPGIARRWFGRSGRHTTIHIHLELEEGECVQVVVEGSPEKLPASASVQGTVQEDHPSAVKEAPGEAGPGLESAQAVAGPTSGGKSSTLSAECGLTSIVQSTVLVERPPAGTGDASLEPGEAMDRVSELDNQGNKQSPILKAATLSAVALFALLPPGLVFLDRWKAANLTNETIGKLWSSVNFLGLSVYPPYFLIVFITILVVFLFVWRLPSARPSIAKPAAQADVAPTIVLPGAKQRRSGLAMLWIGVILIGSALVVQIRQQQVLGGLFLLGMVLFFAGWATRTVPLRAVWQVVRHIWKPAGAFLTFHIFLLLTLSSYYSDRHWLGLWLVLSIISLVFTLYQYHRRIPLVLWVMSLALILYTIRINGWEFSVLGDEYSFFMYARELAVQHDLLYSIDRLFNGVAVFGSHPFFSSFLQMIFIRVFSGTDFAWRFSSLYLSSLALVFFYGFFRTFVKSSLALLASIFLACSHYIMTFGKIGYNNLQSYFILSLVMAAGAWAVRSKSTVAYITLGISMGACFYVYPAALYAIPVAILLMVFFDAPFSRLAFKRWGTTVLALGVLVLPLLLQKNYWIAKVPGTVFWTPDIVASAGSLLGHFVTNLLYAIISFLYIPHESHYVVSSYVDPLSGALILIGLAYLALKGWKSRFIAFFLVGFAAMLFFVGASHGGEYPPNTRMFLLLPWFALFAAAGLEWLKSQASHLKITRAWMGGGLAVILVGVLSLNFYQAYSLSKQRSTGLQSPAMLFMRLVERIQAQKPAPQAPLTIWFLTIPPWGIDGYRLFLTAYDVPENLLHLEKVDMQGVQLPAGVAEKVQDASSLVIIYPDIDAGVQSAIGSSLAALGKQSCPIKTVNGYTRFLLWTSAPVAWACEAGG